MEGDAAARDGHVARGREAAAQVRGDDDQDAVLADLDDVAGA